METIKHIDPFIGEITLKPVGKVILDAFMNTETYYLMDSGEIKKRGLNSGVYIKNDQTKKIEFLSGNKIEMISKIYDKLTRLD